MRVSHAQPPSARRPLRPAPRARRLRRRLRRSRQGPARTRSSGTPCRCSSTSSTAAPAAAKPTPATAPASSSRCRTGSCARRRRGCSIALPPERSYGAGLVFLPSDADAARGRVEAIIERIVGEEGQQVLGWRDVPTDDSELGPRAVAAEPVFRQLFVGRGRADAGRRPTTAFERKLYVIRKRIEHAVDALALSPERSSRSTSSSLSSRTLIYKGMLTASQIAPLFLDLADAGRRVGAGAGAPAVQHQHLPVLAAGASLPLRRPQRRDQHAARQHQLDEGARGAAASPTCSATTSQKILPIIREGGSDTAMFDNVLEFLVMAGRSLPHAMLMMIPEPWQNHESMSPERRAFYEYHSSLMEPWDGPASIAFTDGTHDRRRARPQRPAAVALLRHEGRPGRPGVRGRRARHPARGRRRQGTAAARADVPGRHRAGPHHLGRRDQGRARARAPVRRVAEAAT